MQASLLAVSYPVICLGHSFILIYSYILAYWCSSSTFDRVLVFLGMLSLNQFCHLRSGQALPGCHQSCHFTNIRIKDDFIQCHTSPSPIIAHTAQRHRTKSIAMATKRPPGVQCPVPKNQHDNVSSSSCESLSIHTALSPYVFKSFVN